MAEESIYNLLPKESHSAGAGKTERYTSKYASSVRDQLQATKQPGKLMGLPKTMARSTSPESFLKKGEGPRHVERESAC